MHELGADAAAVGLLQRGVNFLQRCNVLAEEQRAGLELDVHVSGGQLVEGKLKIRNRCRLAQTEGIDVRLLVATEAIGVDQLKNTNLLLVLAALARRDSHRAATVATHLVELLTDRGQRNILGGAAVMTRQSIKVVAPLVGNLVRVDKITLVEIFYVVDIPAAHMGSAPHQLHCAFLHLSVTLTDGVG